MIRRHQHVLHGRGLHPDSWRGSNVSASPAMLTYSGSGTVGVISWHPLPTELSFGNWKGSNMTALQHKLASCQRCCKAPDEMGPLKGFV